MYYVKEINDDYITISNSLEDRVVPRDELRTIIEPIIGYNRVTGVAKVQPKTKLSEYYISRKKLNNEKTGLQKCNQEEPAYFVAGDVKYTKLNDTNIKITLSTDVSELEVATKVFFDYRLFLGIQKYIDFTEGKIVNIHLEFDLFGKDISLDFRPFDYYVSEISNIYICNITFTERTDLSRITSISNMFDFFSIYTYQIEDICNGVENLVIDLSKQKFSPDVKLEHMFNNFVPNVIFPDMTHINPEGFKDFFVFNTVMSMSVLRNINKIGKAMNWKFSFRDCRIYDRYDVCEAMGYKYCEVEGLYTKSLLFSCDCNGLTDIIYVNGDFSWVYLKVEVTYNFVKFIKDLIKSDRYKLMCDYLHSSKRTALDFAEKFKEDLMKVNGYYAYRTLANFQLKKKYIKDSSGSFNAEELRFLTDLLSCS